MNGSREWKETDLFPENIRKLPLVTLLAQDTELKLWKLGHFFLVLMLSLQKSAKELSWLVLPDGFFFVSSSN